MINDIIHGDALEVLKTLEDESIDMCMTSPPYWALRDYGTAIWEGGNEKCNHETKRSIGDDLCNSKQKTMKGSRPNLQLKCKCGAIRKDLQIGLEITFQKYIDNLCDIFDEVKRVIKKEGTCWVNIGDTYMGNSSYSEKGRQGFGNDKIGMINKEKWQDPKYKSAHGKRLRAREHVESGQIKSKSLCQIPSRFAIEMINRGWILRNEIIWYKPNCMPASVKDRFTVDFEKIFFFVKSKNYYFEQQKEPAKDWGIRDRSQMRNNTEDPKLKHHGLNNCNFFESGRNKRCVWEITTKGYLEAHFAVYPEKLCSIPIKAGCPRDGIVLDPFFGSGTTGLVAQKLKRKWIGIELNEEYIKIAKKRLNQRIIL